MADAGSNNSSARALDGAGKVLLVDDQPELRRLFRRHLSKLGYEVVEACNGRAAIELARQTRFEVVISDVRMPDLSGVELLQELFELDPELPVVLVSGGLDAETEQAAAQYGAFGYLMKPVPLEGLSDTTALAVELRRARARGEPLVSMQRLRIPGLRRD